MHHVVDEIPAGQDLVNRDAESDKHCVVVSRCGENKIKMVRCITETNVLIRSACDIFGKVWSMP